MVHIEGKFPIINCEFIKKKKKKKINIEKSRVNGSCGGGFCSTPRKLFFLFGEPSPQGFILSTKYGKTLEKVAIPHR